MLKAVIFDLDGTLYNKRFLKIHIIMAEIRSFHFITLCKERAARLLMRGRDYGTEERFYYAFFRIISRRHPDRVEKWYFHHYMPLQIRLLQRFYHADSWVLPRLEELSRMGVKKVIYSDYGCAKEKLEAIGINPDLFDFIIDAPSLGGLKPSEKSSLRLLEKIGAKPSEVLFVGDRLDCDVAAAERIGAASEFLTRRWHKVRFSLSE